MITSHVTQKPWCLSKASPQIQKAIFPRMSHESYENFLVNWLRICLIDSPESISHLQALSSIGKIQLLAMVPGKGSEKVLLNVSCVTVAAPRVKRRPGQPGFHPAGLAAAAAAAVAAAARVDHSDPPPAGY